MPEEMPPQPKTAQIAAADKHDILLAELKVLVVQSSAAINERVETGFKSVKADMDLLGGQFEGLERDVRGLQSWRVRTEDRQAASSIRARAISDIDLAQDTKLANALLELGEAKAKCERLEANSATKADLEAITKAQTSAIVEGIRGVERIAEKYPTVRMLLFALAGLAFIGITAVTNYITTRVAQSTPAQHQGVAK